MHSSVLFWNIWGHRKPQEIHGYLDKHLDTLDVCCLTEVTTMGQPYDPVPRVHSSVDLSEPPSCIDGREQLVAEFGNRFDVEYVSPHLSSWTCKVTQNQYDKVGFGSALLLKKGLKIIATGNRSILLDVSPGRGRVLQHVLYETAHGARTLVVHVHGVWLAHNTKGDDPVRDRQSELILEYIEALAKRHKVTRVIFGGDLNLDLNTNAIAILERGREVTAGFRNLIREMCIKNTRTPAYRKFGMPDESRFADYVFITTDVHVHQFEVDTDVIASDHAPLRLTFA